jgi:CubicO group peptidase (beta-lactamase class C family)
MNRHDLSIPAYGRNGQVLTLAEQVCNVKNLSFTHEPRSEHMYCNYGYLTLSCVIEKLTGKSFKEVLAEVIWKPLRMDSTYYSAEDIPDSAKEMLSTGYRWDSQMRENIPIGTGLCLPAAAGAGAGITSVRDLAKLVQCFIHEAEPFAKSCHADMKLPRVVAVPAPHYGTDISTYGLGVYRTVYKNTPIFSHSGTLDSHGCEIVWIPDLKFGVVLMANGSGTSNRAGRALAYKLIDDKLGTPASDRVDINAMFVSPFPYSYLFFFSF